MRKQDKISHKKDDLESGGRTGSQGSVNSPAAGSDSHDPAPPHGDPLREQVRGSGTPHSEAPPRRQDGRLPLPD